MDPLYSYSMGIGQQFPHLFLLYTITTYLVAIQKRLILGSRDTCKKLLNFFKVPLTDYSQCE